jgi:hypothetical protein
MLVNVYHSVQHSIPEERELHWRHFENSKSLSAYVWLSALKERYVHA